MPIEIEAKMRVDDALFLATFLDQKTETFKGAVLEKNIYLDRSDHQLRKTDQGLRIRSMHPLKDVSNIAEIPIDLNQQLPDGDMDEYLDHQQPEEVVITYKGPRNHGELKNRRELELTVHNCTDAVALFSGLGYLPALRFEKLRAKWQFLNCEITLDRMPRLGDFMEIEGPSNEQIMEVRQKLNLDDLPLIQTSYAAMLRSYLQNAELTNKDWIRI